MNWIIEGYSEEWHDLGEGPWETAELATEYAQAEVGVPWRVVDTRTREVATTGFSGSNGEQVQESIVERFAALLGAGQQYTPEADGLIAAYATVRGISEHEADTELFAVADDLLGGK
jgi:hypothetical protein